MCPTPVGKNNTVWPPAVGWVFGVDRQSTGMKAADGSEPQKRRAGERAATAVEDGMVVGLGTGSTAAYAIRALGEAVADGLSITGIPTSYQSRALARSVGIELTTLETDLPDIAIDGADQLRLRDGCCIKGGGGAHTREKIVDSAADRCLIVVDETKLATTLDHPVAIELLEAGWPTVQSSLEALGGSVTLREATRKDGPVISDNGNLIADCTGLDDPASLAERIGSLAGIVDHGIFVDIADAVYVGTESDVTIHQVNK